MEASEEELQALLGRAIASRPWPAIGDVVKIAFDWDGKAQFASDDYLNLKAGDMVKVQERSPEGAFFYGSVVSRGAKSMSGWFGGVGCEAAVQLEIPVPIGNGAAEEPPSSIPKGASRAEPSFDDNGGSGVGHIPASLIDDVEAYLSRHGIDGGAADTLRGLDPDMQAEVIKSDITNSRNPSAVLLSRIDRIAKGGTSGPPPPNSKGASKGGYGLTQRAAPPSAARSRSPPPLASRTRPVQEVLRGGRGDRGSEVEDFIHQLKLDERCAGELRALHPAEQRSIVQSDLTNARNPSAVVFSRIQRVKGNQAEQAHRAAVDDYLVRNGIDEVAASAMLALRPEQQEVIMGSNLSNSRNPSAVLLSRIRSVEAQQPVPAGQPPPPASSWRPSATVPAAPTYRTAPPPRERGPPPSRSRVDYLDVEDYVAQHGLDEKVAEELRSLAPHEQDQIMSNGITNARNPNAIVKSRIAAVRKESQLQGAVEDYLARYDVDEGAKTALRELDPAMQQRLIEQEMSNCRNPSAVLLSRIRGMKEGRR
eukprot:TRINITY_DN110195_c0_g1_i1.p1 TRINITY_DN110195_c0_g1~~TRINITY_DN110195_c0_g1_i1.p1  ORF type:complete len:552 (+),score=125.91 TRINITY_DN110195_c0_g1_i1:51-1658(+)